MIGMVLEWEPGQCDVTADDGLYQGCAPFILTLNHRNTRKLRDPAEPGNEIDGSVSSV
jgi:hypothetical protein